MTNKAKGKLITIEAIDGAGKTGALMAIKDYLIERGISVAVSREPGGTAVAENIRSILLSNSDEKITNEAEMLLMFAARSQHIENLINPALESGSWQIVDRFIDSSFSYQVAGRGMSDYAFYWLERFVLKGLEPDLTFLLDLPVEVGKSRVANRGCSDRIDQESIDFFNRVRNGYLHRAKLFPGRIKVINADQSMAEVHKDIVAHLDVFVNQSLLLENEEYQCQQL